MDLNMMIQRSSIGFRSGERGGQLMVLIPSSSRNCCILLPLKAGNYHAPGGTLHCRSRGPKNGSKDFISIPNGSQSAIMFTVQVCACGYASPDQNRPTTKQIMLNSSKTFNE
ncbi:hypothetical protein ILYODFUR_010420 [Ilyodon furcidens]|uniref:Uncharacterized protein n=1 Tax=Ilyodon furcidens TaxID=33524 RepID=A0ABV0TAL1_9TELE